MAEVRCKGRNAAPIEGLRRLVEYLHEFGAKGGWAARLAAQAAGTFHMDILPPPVARERLREASRKAQALPWGWVQQVILVAGLHPGLLAATEVEAAIPALRDYAPAYRMPFGAAVKGRAALAQALATRGPTPIGVQAETAQGREKVLATAVELMSLPCAPPQGSDRSTLNCEDNAPDLPEGGAELAL